MQRAQLEKKTMKQPVGGTSHQQRFPVGTQTKHRIITNVIMSTNKSRVKRETEQKVMTMYSVL